MNKKHGNRLYLDIGCGRRKRQGFIGIDKFKHLGVDIVLDIEREALPFENNSVDYVLANSVLEHLNDIEFVLSEVHRVLKKGGVFEVIVPYHKSIIAISPYHKLFFEWHSFNPDRNRSLQNKNFFKIIERKLVFRGLDFYGVIPLIAGKQQGIYERWLSHFFPAKHIKWLLKKGEQEEMSEKETGVLYCKACGQGFIRARGE